MRGPGIACRDIVRGTVTSVTADENAQPQGPAASGRGAFLVFRFGIELVTLAVLAWAGASARVSMPARIVLAAGLPVVLVVVWGQVMAPTARRRLRDPARLVAEIAIFTASAAALAAAGHVLAAVIYGVIAIAAAGLTRVIAPEA
jgi:hypothetical protein